MMKVVGLILFTFYSVMGNLEAQNSDSLFVIGVRDTIYSQMLQEHRPLIIYTPEKYGKDGKNYPVIYLLDGKSNFHHTSATVNFLARNGRIPECIIVAIPNTKDRTKDLTPSTIANLDQFPSAGGADSMVLFLKDELFPFVEKNHHAADYKILIGHSFGGLFALHTMVRYPGLFNAYIAISPSLWWDNQELVLNGLENYLQNYKDLYGHLYVTMGNEGNTMVGGMWKLQAALEEGGNRNLQWKFNRLPEETHGSIPMRSTYDGLEYIFHDWNIENHEEVMTIAGKAGYKHYLKTVENYYGIPPDLDEGMLRNLAQNNLEAGNFEQAGSVLEVLVEQFPDSWQSHSKYGAYLLRMGQTEKAIPYLQKSLELNPHDGQAKASLLKLNKIEGQERYIPSINEMRSYIGTYQAPNNLKLSISLHNETLYITGDQTPKAELLPLAESRFFVDLMNAEIIFLNEGGIVTGFTANINGQPFGVKKIE